MQTLFIHPLTEWIKRFSEAIPLKGILNELQNKISHPSM